MASARSLSLFDCSSRKRLYCSIACCGWTFVGGSRVTCTSRSSRSLIVPVDFFLFGACDGTDGEHRAQDASNCAQQYAGRRAHSAPRPGRRTRSPVIDRCKCKASLQRIRSEALLLRFELAHGDIREIAVLGFRGRGQPTDSSPSFEAANRRRAGRIAPCAPDSLASHARRAPNGGAPP